MAKLIYRNLLDCQYATMRTFFDDVAEECSMLTVSNDGTSVVLTVDTDLTIKIDNATGASIGGRHVFFYENALVDTTSTTSTTNPVFGVLFSETLFYLFVKHSSSDSTSTYFSVLYEKVDGEKFAKANTSTLDALLSVVDKNNVSYWRNNYYYTRYSISSGSSDNIDYINATALLTGTANNAVRYFPFDDHFLCVTPAISMYKIYTLDDGKDYFSITNSLLVPLDPEEEEE